MTRSAPVSPRSDDLPSGSARARRAAVVALLLLATLAAGAAVHLAPSRGAAARVEPEVTLAAHLDRSSVRAGGDGLVRLELVLRGRDVALPEAHRVPTDLVVVLDRSGSMQGAPLAAAKSAVFELVAGLSDSDRFALVSYATDARVDVPLARADVAARRRGTDALTGLQASGGTNMASGLDRAHALLAGPRAGGRAPRVIVLSDGHANQGDHSLEGLRGRAGRAVASEYVLSSVGIGAGFDENVMSALADAGTGNFYYLPDASRLAGVFADEFASARESVARAVSVVVSPGAGVRVASAAGYPLEREGATVRFHPGDLFAGQERRIWLTLQAPTDAAGSVALGSIRADFATPEGERQHATLVALPALACVADDADYFASFDAESYRRANLGESLGALKQSIARQLAGGRRDEAVAELEAYEARSRAEQLRAFGRMAGEEEQELDALRDELSAPAAAEPEQASRLGKRLLEEGRDDQRAGSKR